MYFIFCKKFAAIKFLTIAIVVFFFCVCINTITWSQDNNKLPDKINIITRNFVTLIGKNGFCGDVIKELKTELKTHGSSIGEVEDGSNDGKGEDNYRYQGLTHGAIKQGVFYQYHLLCGTNSITDNNDLLTDDNTLKKEASPHREKVIKFSKPFYETGIKLMIKKELLKKELKKDFSQLSTDEVIDYLKKHHQDKKIGVEKNTTTLAKLQGEGFGIKPFNSRNDLISSQEEIKASDAIILRSFPGNDDYVIFPKGNQYLLNEGEKYSIAISYIVKKDGRAEKLGFSDELKTITDKVIEKVERDKNYRQQLRDFENGNQTPMCKDGNCNNNFLIIVSSIFIVIGIVFGLASFWIQIV
jgi:hypothetical protein